MTQVLDSFFSDKHYDIRKTGNGRWIDQKCTYDVVSFVADCICYYLENGGTEPLQSTTIWRSDYAVKYVQDVFGKPYPLDEESHDEFNKSYRQPMKMLAAAGVLEESGRVNNTIQYVVLRKDALEYLALRPWHAEQFLETYIEKTLRDSGLWNCFDTFFKTGTRDSFEAVKSTFERFCYAYTPIKNKKETGRIFSKVLNPLAFKNKTHGTADGHLSPSIITLSDLTYNRPNFRDEATNKDKNIARRSYVNIVGDSCATRDYIIAKQARLLKQFNSEYRSSHSEVVDELAMGVSASQAHHIFPKSRFPEIADYLENLIMLTSSQHYEKAHPNGNTQAIDPGYQYSCLMHKVKSIKENLENEIGIPKIYDLEKLKRVLDVGFETDYFEMIDFDNYEAIGEGIRVQYAPATIATYTPIRFD